MTTVRTQHPVLGTPAVRDLDDSDLPEVAALCALDPVGSVLAAARVEAALVHGLARTGGQAWGFPAQGPLAAVCWSGANLVPVVPEPEPEVLDAFAARARTQGRRCSSIVGPAAAALGLWRRLEGDWGPSRSVRTEQPSMVIQGEPLVDPDPALRASTRADLPHLLPACVRMFEEEVGYSPMTYSGRAYEERVGMLVAERRSFLSRSHEPDGRIVFKAEIGALTRDVAQIQGVWVDPLDRGTGRAAPGMAAVVLALRAGEATGQPPRSSRPARTVSLYVNSFNTRALATYRRVGFEQVGTYATVLF